MTDADLTPATFFAYPGTPRLVAESMDRAATRIGTGGFSTRTWEELVVEGRVLVSRIQDEINSRDELVAEITSLNANVLFEVGYAIAKDKRLFLAVDGTDAHAERNLKAFGLLTGIGYFDYGGDSGRLSARYLSTSEERSLSPTTWADLTRAFRKRPEPRTLFLYPTSHRGDAPRDLDRLLSKRRDLAVLRADEDERGYAPLAWYAELVYRASASLLYMLGPQRARASVHNARASLLAGLSVGLNKPTLMLAESSFEPPIDYQDLLYRFDTSREMQKEANRWLDDLPSTLQRRPERLPEQLGLPIRFGEYVAENEQDQLGEYFVETAEFASVISGDTGVFVGRKGTGKTAAMLQASEVLTADRRNLVVVVKPGAYELEALVSVIDQLSARDTVDFFLSGMWEYLLHCEIAASAVREAEARPAGIAVGSPLDTLRAYLEANHIGLDQDVGSRLDGLVSELLGGIGSLPYGVDAERHFLNEHLHESMLHDLRRVIGECLADRQRVALLIDNLDKAWERGADYEKLSRIVFGLLTAIGKVDRSYARSGQSLHAVNVTLAVFLRADIFSKVLQYAREPDKIKVLQIRWESSDLLARVIEDRYQANAESSSGQEVWHELFCPTVREAPTRNYLLWRCLSRPRDLVYLANSAVMAAVNRRHEVVAEQDVLDAEREYSQFAFEALLVESDPDAELGDLLFEFAGCDATLTRGELEALLPVEDERKGELIGALLRSSFLGLETRDDFFEFITDENSERKANVLATRLQAARGAAARYRIHPAFRPYLDITDDDLDVAATSGQASLLQDSPREVTVGDVD